MTTKPNIGARLTSPDGEVDVEIKTITPDPCGDVFKRAYDVGWHEGRAQLLGEIVNLLNASNTHVVLDVSHVGDPTAGYKVFPRAKTK